MRLDFEAAEEAYRSDIQEQDRQAQLGIAVSTAHTDVGQPRGST